MKRKHWRLSLAGLWLLVTLSLSAWWMIHGMKQAAQGGAASPEEIARQQRMLFWEGSFLLSILTLGGVSLCYFIYRDQKNHEELQSFFSTFTHELKTSLTSLRLQAEILEEKHAENENLQRLLKDVVRLELQLENALILAQAEQAKLFVEDIPLKKTLHSLSAHWPHLKVTLAKDAQVLADQRALECILRNLIQNASVHGNAKHVQVEAKEEAGRLALFVSDDGKGFSGDPTKLGRSFTRHTTRSGAGIGLYLSRILAKKMGGDLSFQSDPGRGLQARLQIGGHLS